MTVLKDAASTAIYGSRGANGVVVITTKQGKKGSVKFSYSARAGFGNKIEDPFERIVTVIDKNDYSYNEIDIEEDLEIVKKKD